jgi:hypothetical protein
MMGVRRVPRSHGNLANQLFKPIIHDRQWIATAKDDLIERKVGGDSLQCRLPIV